MTTKNKLKVGILIDSLEVNAWEHKMLSEIYNSDYAEIKLFIQNNTLKVKGSFFHRLLEQKDKLLYTLFMKFERKIYQLKQNPFEPKSVSIFPLIPVIQVIPYQNKFGDSFPDNIIEEIKKFELDVIIKLGFRNLEGDILKASKYGIWSYYHGDNLVNRGGPPGFWEVMGSWDDTGSLLQIIMEDPGYGKILYRSYSLTDPHSVLRNISICFWKSSMFIPRKLKELYREGVENFFVKVKKNNQHPDFYSNKLFKIPDNIEMIILLGKLLFKYIKEKFNEFFYLKQWHLQYEINKKNKLSKSFFRFKRIIPPKDRSWADPDFIKKNDKYYIFFEEYIYSKKRGHISFIELSEDGKYSDPKIVLQKNYHMSFPFVFNVDDNYYMLPETSENKTIELYKCVQFPDRWKLENILINNISAVDTNLFFYKNKWWLFANIKECEGASIYDELFLFFSDDFKSSKWAYHPQNPVISDVKSARPAGHIFLYNNNIYRPSQNCSKRYGYGMKINQITALSENEYKEKIISNIEPNWGRNFIGTHTLNYKDDFIVVDVLQKKRKYL